MGNLWSCTHKNYAGEKMTILHDGDQCLDEDHQSRDCNFYQKTWEFISCVSATGVIVKEGRNALRIVAASTIKSGVKPGSRRNTDDDYPSQSDPGKCELQIDKSNKLYCLPRGGCRGECAALFHPYGTT